MTVPSSHSLLNTLTSKKATKAGVFISGASGFGKSQLMLLMTRDLARKGRGLTYITPHGSDADKFRAMMLSEPPHVRRRFLEIHPADTSKILRLDPLRVVPSNDPLVFGARLAAKTGHVGRILLSTSGETEWGPRKFAWLHRCLYEGGRLGLPLLDVQHFTYPGSELFGLLVEAVPHYLNKMAFQSLANLPPARQEELMEAVRNRFVRLFANSLIEAMLCSSGDCFDPTELMDQNRIVLINLERGTVFTDEEVSLLANLFLAEYLHATFCDNDPPEHWFFLDELQVYGASFPELISILPQVRKFNKPIVAATQGTVVFPEGSEDRLLNMFLAQCGITVALGHAHPQDCEYFGRLMGLASYDPMNEKNRIIQSQQYTAGYEDITLVNRSVGITASQSAGRSESETDTSASTWNASNGTNTGQSKSFTQANGTNRNHSDHLSNGELEQVRQAVGTSVTNSFGGNESRSESSSRSRGGSSAHASQRGNSSSNSKGATLTISHNVQRVPILAWRDFVSSITYFTPEEHFLSVAAQISSFRPGQALVRIASEGTLEVQFRMPEYTLKRAPRARARAFAKYAEFLRSLTLFTDPEDLVEQRREFWELLTWQLRRIARQRSEMGHGGNESTLLSFARPGALEDRTEEASWELERRRTVEENEDPLGLL